MREPGELSRKIYERLLKAVPDGAPRLRLWDGTTMGPDDADATIALQHPGAFRAILLPPGDLTAGEAYMYDDVDFEGDIVSVMHWGARLDRFRRSPTSALAILRAARKLPAETRRGEHERPELRGRLHSKERDSVAIRHHYDVSNEFYEQFLDPEMVYSCGYFLTQGEDLAKAQIRKLDLICRKLDLQPGQRFLDVGCGWGALVIHAARHYGVDATGVTVSHRQYEYALERVQKEGLADRVRILKQDYRDIKGEFDAIASVGMFEHVGRRALRTYFRKLRGILSPGGALLNHGIGTRDRNPGRRRPTFVNTYVFPDGELIGVDTVLGIAEDSGFEVRDLESMRISYARTLRAWLANLERNHHAAVATSSEITYRVWRAYMAGSVVAFELGGISVYQMLCVDPARWWTLGRSELIASDD